MHLYLLAMRSMQAQVLTHHQSEPRQDLPCVLVIEDDELAQARLELLIEAVGLAAVSVPSAEKARAALAAVFFPIVILDRMLEDGDGISLCKEVRRQQSTSRVYLILLSALDSAHDVAMGLAAGADAYLSKRSSDDEFIASLKTALNAVTPASK
jgi:DNA-binding response OmpR family regulator